MTINEKIKFLDDYEKGNGSRLAKEIEIHRNTIDSLINGDHQPRFAVLAAIIKRYPNLNPKWLFIDTDEIWLSPTQSDGQTNNLADSLSNLVESIQHLLKKNQSLETYMVEIKRLKEIQEEQEKQLKELSKAVYKKN